MKRYVVRLSPQAGRDQEAMYTWITAKSSAAIANAFVTGLLSEVESLATAPERGSIFQKTFPQVRTIGYRRAVTIVFSVQASEVRIIRLLYRGRNRSQADLR